MYRELLIQPSQVPWIWCEAILLAHPPRAGNYNCFTSSSQNMGVFLEVPCRSKHLSPMLRLATCALFFTHCLWDRLDEGTERGSASLAQFEEAFKTLCTRHTFCWAGYVQQLASNTVCAVTKSTLALGQPAPCTFVFLDQQKQQTYISRQGVYLSNEMWL